MTTESETHPCTPAKAVRVPVVIYPATKALSVYNMLSFARQDVSQADLLSRIQEAAYPDADEAWIAEGVAFLLERGFAAEVDGKLTPARPRGPDGRCWPLRRAKADTELRWA
jgi:hypothetical protein